MRRRTLLALEAARTISPIAPRSAFAALATLEPLLALAGILGAFVTGFGDHFLVAVILIIVARAPLILEADPALAQHAEIMVGELQIIFALDAVAGKLRVAREALVLLEQLRCVAALPIVLAVASGLSPEVLSPLPPTTAPATALSLIDQIRLP
jgi:hypothetical protein